MQASVTTEIAAIARVLRDLGQDVVIPDHRSCRRTDTGIRVDCVAWRDFSLEVTHDTDKHRATFRMSERAPSAMRIDDCRRRAERRPTPGMRFSVGVERGHIWACCVATDGASTIEALQLLEFLFGMVREWRTAFVRGLWLTDSVLDGLMDRAIGLAYESGNPHPLRPVGRPNGVVIRRLALPPARSGS